MMKFRWSRVVSLFICLLWCFCFVHYHLTSVPRLLESSGGPEGWRIAIYRTSNDVPCVLCKSFVTSSVTSMFTACCSYLYILVANSTAQPLSYVRLKRAYTWCSVTLSREEVFESPQPMYGQWKRKYNWKRTNEHTFDYRWTEQNWKKNVVLFFAQWSFMIFFNAVRPHYNRHFAPHLIIVYNEITMTRLSVIMR
jgi:hypothetical protein